MQPIVGQVVGQPGSKTLVALCTPDGKELLTASGDGGPILKRVRWDVQPFVGRRLVLQIVDRSTGGWGHVTFDISRCECRGYPFPSRLRGSLAPKASLGKPVRHPEGALFRSL